MTELCFNHCADNFFDRELSTDESNCLDKCVLKFSNVNQRVMNAYVHDQTLINERRMKEMEEQAKVANLSAANDVNAALTNSSEISTTLSIEPTLVPPPADGHTQSNGT